MIPRNRNWDDDITQCRNELGDLRESKKQSGGRSTMSEPWDMLGIASNLQDTRPIAGETNTTADIDVLTGPIE
jgi:hypothetical protein